MKREAELKSAFVQELKRQAPGAMVLQYSTNGAPDREVVLYGRTSRWEFKHATPDFESPGDQALCCARLAAVGHCRYVIWQERNGLQQTLIVHPRNVVHRIGWDVAPEVWCVGFDMKWLVEQVLKEHGR